MAIAGLRHFYQIKLSLLVCAIFFASQFFNIGMNYYTRPPVVVYFDPASLSFKQTFLDYSVCSLGFEISFEHRYTLGSKIGIYCNYNFDLWLGLQMIIGLTLSSIFLGFLCDTYGRKRTLLISCGSLSFLCFVSVNVTSLWLIILSFFLLNFFTALAYGSAIILVSESVSSKVRPVALSFVFICPIFIDPLLSYFLELFGTFNFIFLGLSVFLLTLLIVMHYHIIESPQFYLITGRWDAFFMNLRKIAKMNSRLEKFELKTDYPQILYNIDGATYQVDLMDKSTEENCIQLNCLRLKKVRELFEVSSKYSTFTKLCFIKYKSQLLKFLFLIVSWLSIYAFSQKYATNLFFFLVKMDHSSYKRMAYQLAGIALSILFMSYVIGRKYSFMIFYSSSVVFFVISFFVGDFTSEACSSDDIFAFLLSGLFMSFTVYSIEMFPTLVRATAFGLTMSLTRFASVTFYFLYFVFGSMTFYLTVAGCSALMLVLIYMDTSEEFQLMVPELGER